MNAVLREYASKGIFLGLWIYLSLVHPSWETTSLVIAWLVGGLVVGLLLGTFQQISRGYMPTRNPLGFLMLVLLDSPFFIYLGVLGGLGIGIVVETNPPDDRRWWLPCSVLAGALLGYGFLQLRMVKDRMWRFGLGAAIGAGMVYLGLSYALDLNDLKEITSQKHLGLLILIGLPFFYLLTFCAEEEESEVEIAALCAALGIGLYLQRIESGLPDYGDKLIFLVPLIIYFVYVMRVLPGLKVFKHTMRGYGYVSLGKIRPAILAFGRAMQLDPRNELARNGLYGLHRKVDVTKLDDDTVVMLNFDICAQLAQSYLIQDRSPTEKEREEALRLLDTVEKYKPELLPWVDYLKAVAWVHGKDFDLAAGYLNRLLDPEQAINPPVRNKHLYAAWDLALRLHPEMVTRLGWSYLEKPGRRIEAIAATERQLRFTPEDPSVIELSRSLYAGLTEAEFLAACTNGQPPEEFNYDYVEQLGLAYLDDSGNVDRGMEYLRIAGHGLPSRAPSIFTKLADVAAARGQTADVRGYLEQVKRAGVVTNLAPDQKQLYFTGLKRLIEESINQNDFVSAASDQELLVSSGFKDINNMRKLAELYAKSGDVLNGVRIVECALLEAKGDADLLSKKDSYYYSLDTERVASVKEKVESWFDVTFCLNKAKAVADQLDPDLDTLEYGNHMAKLARIVKPQLHSAMVAEARILLRRGERDAAMSLLEDVREQKRGSGDEEDAWFLATRILADLYLNELSRPDLAIAAYNDYREYQKSGGETLFQLGKAYEAAGNVPSAIKSYESVTAYEKHPRYWDATEAVRRLKEGG